MAAASRYRVIAVVAVAIAAGAVLRRTVAAVRSGGSNSSDDAVRRRVLAMRSDAGDVASSIVTALTAPALLVPANWILAYAFRRRGLATWLPIAAAPVAAMTAGAVFSRTLPQHHAPDSKDCEPCFPSGHTTGLTAEVMTVAYVLCSDGAISSSFAVLALCWSLASGINRLYRDRHWASDIVAGWSAGLVVSSCCALTSEVLRTQQR
jgi:membrane-associated phospholipid phosphatase